MEKGTDRSASRIWRASAVVSVIAVAWLRATAVGAQITTATLSGSGRDQTGGVLAGVDVTANNEGTGVARSSVTDGDGNYTIPGLPSGSYDVRAMLQGFR